MATFTSQEADHYGGQGGSGYFTLRDDGDVAAVRFLYNTVDDVLGHSVHQVEIDGKKRYVNCLRAYNEPLSKCPFCEAHQFQMAKLFIPLYNIDEDKVQVWERGKTFFANITSLCNRYGQHPIVSQIFEVERHGKKGDTSTTYQIFRTEDPADDMTLDDFEKPNILGGLILDKSPEEMSFYLANGYFESTDTPNNNERPHRNVNREERPRRRTPVRDEAF